MTIKKILFVLSSMNILVTGANGLLGNLEGDSKYLITYLANRKDYYLYYVDDSNKQMDFENWVYSLKKKEKRRLDGIWIIRSR